MLRRRALIAAVLALAALSLLVQPTGPAKAAEPAKIGFSMALTGGSAVVGKQILAALEIWRDDQNAKGGLLGRPVQLVYYDDQSNPGNVPGIYTKLISVDKVDMVIGPYATNMVAAAMPVIMQHNMVDISILALGVNAEFKHPRYFSTLPVGQKPKIAYSKGFFELAMAQNPKPKTVAIVAADAEFARNSSDGARENAKAVGLKIVYDKAYPPPTTDFSSIIRAIQATSPDIVFAAAYPPDTIGLVRAANELNFSPKMFGGSLIGLLATGPKVQLGPLMDGIVVNEIFMPSPAFEFPGTKELLAKYQAKAPALGVDLLGYGFPPFAYAAGQILAQAVEGTKSFDQAKIAAYIHANTMKTVIGEINYGTNGEWKEERFVFTQFQNIKPNNVDQFRNANSEVIIWPAQHKTGNFIYPYANARKK
jgi:branched-chain amino acid transport system substrate-binding protein